MSENKELKKKKEYKVLRKFDHYETDNVFDEGDGKRTATLKKYKFIEEEDKTKKSK